MKFTFYLLCMLLAATNGSRAQSYHSFPATHTLWAEYNRPHGDSSFRIVYYGLKDRDTVINYITYHQLYRSADTMLQQQEFYGGLREDAAGRKVYCIIPAQSADELLLYDFSLNKGDTLKATANGGRNNWNTNGDDLTVSVVDSVLLDGSYRKRMRLSYLNSPVESTWVEGVGNIIRGLLFYPGNYPGNGTWNELLCLRQQHQWTYHATSSWSVSSFIVPSCDSLQTLNPPSLGISSVQSNDNGVQFYPNPMSGLSQLTIKDAGRYKTLTIYNTTGSKLSTMKLEGKTTVSFNSTDFLPGLYYYCLESKNGTYVSGRFTVR